MLSKVRLSLGAVCLVILAATTSQPQQVSGGWTDLTPGQVAYGIRYAEDGKVWSAGSVVATCRPDQFTLHLSSPSSVKGFAALLCKSSIWRSR